MPARQSETSQFAPKPARSSGASTAIEAGRLENFYGRDSRPKVRYVRERKRLEYGMAHEDEYKFELLEDPNG